MFKQKVHQNKEQKEAIKKQEAEVLRQRDIIKNSVFPILAEKTANIAEVKKLCGAITVALQQAANRRIMEETVESLGLYDFIAKDKDFDVIRDLLEVLSQEKVSVCNNILDGMGKTIDVIIAKESTVRTLKELVPDVDKLFHN